MLRIYREQIKVQGNLFEDIGTGGVNFGGAKDVIISNNIFKNAYGTQSMLSTFSRESKNIVISNNTFSGCGWECCVLSYVSNFNILNNYFEDFGYGVSCENISSDINISNNIFNGLKSNRTHTGEGMQTHTYGVMTTKSNAININSNTFKECTFGYLLAGQSTEINCCENNINNCLSGVDYSGDNNGNINFSNNIIKECNNGIKSGSHGKISFVNNIIDIVNIGIKLDNCNSNTDISIINNNITGETGIDESGIYNLDCKHNGKKWHISVSCFLSSHNSRMLSNLSLTVKRKLHD